MMDFRFLVLHSACASRTDNGLTLTSIYNDSIISIKINAFSVTSRAPVWVVIASHNYALKNHNYI